MESVKAVKVVFATIFGILSSFLGALTIPVLTLVACNIIDYVTAIIATPYRGQTIDSDVGIHGIKKKVTMWILVIVGSLVDIIIKYSIDVMGLPVQYTFVVACVVAMWLVCNELLSILENINDIGVRTPRFLDKLVKNIKCQVEEKADVTESQE